MFTIHLFTNYNNYYNRQVKFKNTLAEYLADQDIYLISFTKRNFVVADGIRTSHIIEYSQHLPTPNYLIAEDETTHEFTRWFVLECRQNRGMQYSLRLKRDTVADFYNTIKLSPLLIKKGYVDDNSVLVFNKEVQEYNKVKKDELLIQDKTESGYVVGFIDSKADHTGKIETTYKNSLQVDFDYSSLSSDITNIMAIGSATPVTTVKRIANDNNLNVVMKTDFGIYNDLGVVGTASYDGSIYTYLNGSVGKPSWITDSRTKFSNGYYANLTYETVLSNDCIISAGDGGNAIGVASDVANNVANKFNNNFTSFIEDIFNIDIVQKARLNNYAGKICQINGVYYKCQIERVSINTEEFVLPSLYLSLAKDCMPNDYELSTYIYNNQIPRYSSSPNNMTINDFKIYGRTEQVYLKLVQQNTNIYTNLTPSANRNHLIDNPYDMFVIPYSDTLEYEVNSTRYLANKNMAINLAQAICKASASSVFDIQIVPFCPFQDNAVINNLDFSLMNSEAIKLGIDDSIIGYYFWAEKSSGSFSIEETRNELTLIDETYSFKEITQLKQFFLCSPNKESIYEFNPAMNKGIKKWIISYDYRPFGSYVKVQPEWNYLYSLNTSYYNNLSDQRGLIFNGSYSITQLDSAWSNYVNNNKNYQQIFDTEIKTQLSQNKLQNQAYEETIGLRSYNINPIKAVMNVIGMEKEIDFMRETQSIDINARRQLFNYQLDNIKSQPNTIRKITSINSDFRIFPFVEVYDTTSEDRENFKNLIKYNGMTVMVTGFLENYLKPNEETFIQGTVIRFSDFVGVENDYTLVSDINNELEMGLYITKEV